MFRSFLAVACLTIPAAAQDIDCANAKNQMELNQCAYADWGAADVDLNAVYKRAIALLTSWDGALPEGETGAATALKDAQRAWIIFRDKACAAEGFAMKGGSAEPLLVYGCMRQLTVERTNHLIGMVEIFDR